MNASRMRVGLTERLFGPVVSEIPDPPAIPGWRLIDIETTDLAEHDGVLVVVGARVRGGRFGGLTIRPTSDAYYVRDRLSWVVGDVQ